MAEEIICFHAKRRRAPKYSWSKSNDNDGKRDNDGNGGSGGDSDNGDSDDNIYSINNNAISQMMLQKVRRKSWCSEGWWRKGKIGWRWSW